LIVVAIIAILAAIAVPNFLEAQVRSKVSRVHADLRSIGIACESYMVDKNDYPVYGVWLSDDMNAECLDQLTSPVAYITMSRFKDPFNIPKQGTNSNPKGYYQYHSLHHPDNNTAQPWMYRKAFIIFSFGPDRHASSMDWLYNLILDPNILWTAADAMCKDPDPVSHTQMYDGSVNGCLVYDPTNGTKSLGDIGRTQGEVPAGLPTILGGGAH
jgi:Tfp pilus assembly protein PilE